MLSPDEDEATSHFLWTASKLLRKISTRSNSKESNLDTISTALRIGRYGFLDCRRDKQYLCPRCNNSWSEGRFSMRVHSTKIPRRVKKWIRKTPDGLSQYERRLLDFYKLKLDNVMVIRCHICRNVTKCFMSKRKDENLPVTVVKPYNEQKCDTRKRKKKRKKDILAGLKLGNTIKTKDTVLFDSNTDTKKDKSIQFSIKGINGSGEVAETNIDSEEKLMEDCFQQMDNLKIIIDGKNCQEELKHSNLLRCKPDKVVNITVDNNRHQTSIPEKSEKKALVQQDCHESYSDVTCTSNVNNQLNSVLKQIRKSVKSTNSSGKNHKLQKIEENRKKLKKKKQQLKSKKTNKKTNSQLKDFIKSL